MNRIEDADLSPEALAALTQVRRAVRRLTRTQGNPAAWKRANVALSAGVAALRAAGYGYGNYNLAVWARAL